VKSAHLLYVRPSGHIVQPISHWMCFREIYENLESPNLIKIGQKLRALYMWTDIYFIVAGDIK
jgi:hypothetical protein